MTFFLLFLEQSLRQPSKLMYLEDVLSVTCLWRVKALLAHKQVLSLSLEKSESTGSIFMVFRNKRTNLLLQIAVAPLQLAEYCRLTLVRHDKSPPQSYVYMLGCRHNSFLRDFSQTKPQNYFFPHSTSSRMWISSDQMPRTKYSALNTVSQVACTGKKNPKNHNSHILFWLLNCSFALFFFLYQNWWLWLLLCICWI